MSQLAPALRCRAGGRDSQPGPASRPHPNDPQLGDGAGAQTPALLALRALQHRGVRGASRAAGKGAGGTGRRRFCLKQRRVLCRVSRHLWWPRRKAAPCPRTWGADDGGTGRG